MKGIKIDPNYAFLHVFPLIFHHVFSKLCKNDKETPLFPSFHDFAPHVRTYIVWSLKKQP